jgi:hypothetical protein
MTRAALLSAAFLIVAACSTTRDPHAPKTILAPGNGGSVTLSHGQRLRIPLADDPKGVYAWRRIEPLLLAVVAEGPPTPQGFNYTPVRTGTEKLRFEYAPASGQGEIRRTVSYEISVR